MSSILRVTPIQQSMINYNRSMLLDHIAQQDVKGREYFVKKCNLEHRLQVEVDTLRPHEIQVIKDHIMHNEDEMNICFEYKHELNNKLERLIELENAIIHK